MKSLGGAFLLICTLVVGSCSGGGSGGGSSDFRLIEFLENGQNQIPRNRELTFIFSAPARENQDFFERLKIQDVQTGANSNFSVAIGLYVIDGERVRFSPRLPNFEDRGDAGLRANAKYTVFLKGGPDALVSETGSPIARPQEFTFDTNEYFEDEVPGQPPRVEGFYARDVTLSPTAPRMDLSRLDPRRNTVAMLDSADLIAANRVIEPGVGSNYGTPWQFELDISEPLDPSTVTADNIEMIEVFSDATTSGDTAPPSAAPGYYGNPAGFKVPVKLAVSQQMLDDQGEHIVRIVVTPLFTLVDNTRYRISFTGQILGIDFREQFIGANGLTGDGQTILPGETIPYPEPGGLGYTTEFIVRDRPSIVTRRTLTYDPLVDSINPEKGQTATDPAKFNTALYNPPGNPSTAVGFLSAFGNGADGNLAVGGGTTTIDTGDTLNPALNKPFSVQDLNPDNKYNTNTLPGGVLTYDSVEPFELNLESLTISSGATLKITGVNPILIRVQGIVQITGTLDAGGEDGQPAGGSLSFGGAGGPGAAKGGDSKKGDNCNTIYSGCQAFSFYLGTYCTPDSFPHSLNGEGPGRGYAGGEGIGLPGYGSSTQADCQSGTGGGGASHATAGQRGEDLTSAGAATGSDGNCASGYTFATKNSGVVGVRGMPGPLYGEPLVIDILWGGSGGGSGGATYDFGGSGLGQSGGAGGGGGGSVTIISAGSIIATAGKIDVSGGKGGDGQVVSVAAPPPTLTGGGGGGSGGCLVLISGSEITVSAVAGVLDASGGAGGARPQPSGNCTQCNAGGKGGNGYIFLVDADGVMAGLLPGTPGTYPNFATGYLTIADFSGAGDRFGDIRAITELFNVLAANPAYLNFNEDRDGNGQPDKDILGVVSNGQEIEVFATTAKADADNPLVPDLTTEMPVSLLVARVRYELGASTVDVFDNMDQLNPTGPDRDAFLRIDSLFHYPDPVQAALGPFAYMDRVDIWYSFN